MSAPTDIKLLHTWTVSVTKTVPRTSPEVVNGQTVSVTRDVTEPIPTRFALRDLTRKERRAADLFLASRTAHYVKDHGLLLASELTNRLINTTGGVLTDREKSRHEQLRAKHVELDMDLARMATATEGDTAQRMEKERVQKELSSVRSELINLNAINESVYAQTAEAKAQSDQSNWITFHTIMVEKAGRWVQYFEGTDFDAKEAAMWAMEEATDALYIAALPTFSTYSYWFAKGVDTPEGFKLIEAELEKQRATREAEAKALADAALPPPPADPVTEPTSPDAVPQAVTAPVAA